jgi:hypothetical protein
MWLLAQSVAPKTKIENVITDDALAMLSEKLSAPLQFEYYLTRALEEAYKVGQKSVGADMIENALAKTDPAGLQREGLGRSSQCKSFLSGQLASGRAQELQSELLAAGNSRFSYALMWSSPNVVGLFSINVVSFSRNVVVSGPRPHIGSRCVCQSGLQDGDAGRTGYAAE